jgi:hypothetical protein
MLNAKTNHVNIKIPKRVPTAFGLSREIFRVLFLKSLEKSDAIGENRAYKPKTQG